MTYCIAAIVVGVCFWMGKVWEHRRLQKQLNVVTASYLRAQLLRVETEINRLQLVEGTQVDTTQVFAEVLNEVDNSSFFLG